MKKLVIASLLAVVAAASQAQAYLQADFGSSTVSAGGDSASKGSFGLGLGYQVNPNFAVDVKYSSLYKDSSKDQKSSAMFVRGIGVYPINDKMSLNGKLGFGSYKVSEAGDSGKGSLTYGVGMDFMINKQVSFAVDVDFYSSKENSVVNKTKNTNIGFGVKYKF